ncbi:MAG: hypothetical protein KDK64_07605, partial [Chlamydiia bacterium]|nr:hypothetical protein [Chlamydiia bacterium]
MLASYAPGIEGDLIPFLAELDKDEEDALLSSELQFMTTVVTENAVGILGGIAGTVGSVWGIGDATGHWSLFGTPSCPEIETSNRLLSLLIKAAAPETARSLITCVSAPVFVFIGLAYAGAKIDVARSKLNQSRLKRLSKKVDSIEEELRSSVLSHREEQQLKQALIFFDVAYSPKSFYRACIRGDIRRIKKWFEENPQRVNEEYQEKSYLIIAIIAGRVPIVGELLSRESSLMYKKGDPGIGGSQKWSPFVFSIYYDKKEAMEKMVALDPLLLNKR